MGNSTKAVTQVVDWDAYSRRVFTRGATRRDRVISMARDMVEPISSDHPSYQECIVDGEHSVNLLVMGSDALDTKKFKVMPEDAQYMHYGAVVQWDDGYWLVTDLDFDDTITKNGYMQYCNMLLRFQIGNSPEIHERWGVFDPGVYSTTTKETSVIPELNWQYKVFLPYDEQTRLLYVDKRFSIGKLPTKDGEVLECYKFTKRDVTSQSIGDDRVLIMYCKSDAYDSTADNFEEMICDYIVPDSNHTDQSPIPADVRVEISYNGEPEIRIGGSGKTFFAKFLDDGGNVVDDLAITWSLSVDATGINIVNEDSEKCKVVLSDNVVDGTLFGLTVSGTDGNNVFTNTIALEAVLL